VTRPRHGGELAVESLTALGVDAFFGVPGVHALALWDGLRRHDLTATPSRTELAAAFAADGYARVAGRPGALFLSTGPGALNSLTAVMEAARAHAPMVVVVSQVPRPVLGRGRGYLHELSEQLQCFSPLTKVALRAETAEALPGTLAQAWEAAIRAPAGPAVVEVPVDVLAGETAVEPLEWHSVASPPVRQPSSRDVRRVATLLREASRPVIWAGGGAVRAGAAPSLERLARALAAPVCTTYMGKGVVPEDFSLHAGSACDDRAFQELIEEADVLLCLGTELGSETTGQWSLELPGTVVQVDAAPARLGATYPVLPVVADVRAFLDAVLAQVAEPADEHSRQEAERRVAAVRARIREGLAAQDRATELAVLDAVHHWLGSDGMAAFDMTIAGYWAAAHLDVHAPEQFLYPLGSGTLGFAVPAATGAWVASPGRRCLAVVGDGGFQYGLAELGTLAQLEAGVTVLVVDDGGYGILREYQQETFGATSGTDLRQPSFAGLATAFGIPVRTTDVDGLAGALAERGEHGPRVVVLRATLRSALPTK